MRIVHLHEDDWQIERDVRLASLRDAPWAFGSTLEASLRLDEAGWRRRVASQHSVVAFDDHGAPIGRAGWLREDQSGLPMLVGVWVAPGARGTGAGDALVRAVLDDCRRQGAGAIILHVNEGNAPAERLYARHGFARVSPTDEPQPDANEVLMRRSLDISAAGPP